MGAARANAIGRSRLTQAGTTLRWRAASVAIARALINNPAVLLADEPSGNLDSKNRDEIHRLFFELREELGQTTVLVTHDEGLAASTDRCIRLSDGLICNP